jgi:type IV fimbrial biogenesis protein FimT
MDRRRGFTLPELVFTLAIAVGLLGWGVPTFREIRLNSARTSQVNAFVQGVYFARSEAIKRNGAVSLCPSADGSSCGGAGIPWHAGWIVFVNDDRDSPADRDDAEDLLRVYRHWPDGHVNANRSTLTFRAFGQMGVTATIVFCDARGAPAARAVIISQTGRPRVTNRSSSGGALPCA